MHYDVAIIGAGPGGIYSAYELIKRKPDLKICLYDSGNALDKRKCPIDGKKIKSCTLVDDPADHRGILSWAAQPRNSTLHEAGSYGYLVKAKIPAGVAKDGKVTIRIESTGGGLAVYGPDFGRYPFGPKILKK